MSILETVVEARLNGAQKALDIIKNNQYSIKAEDLFAGTKEGFKTNDPHRTITLTIDSPVEIGYIRYVITTRIWDKFVGYNVIKLDENGNATPAVNYLFDEAGLTNISDEYGRPIYSVSDSVEQIVMSSVMYTRAIKHFNK